MMKSSYELRAPIASKKHTPETNYERLGKQHTLMMRYVENLAHKERKTGELEDLVSGVIHPKIDKEKAFGPVLSKEYRKMGFKPDLNVVEPATIDDLEDAKKTNDEARVEEVRSVMRAMSWMAHGRTDDEVASKLTSKFLHEAHTRAPQRGFDHMPNEIEIAEWTRVLNTLQKGAQTQPAQCGDSVEEAVQFVERKIVEAWKQLISNAKKSKGAWPTTYPATDAPILSESVRRANERLINLRHIRDQLYFLRLYPKLCMYARGK